MSCLVLYPYLLLLASLLFAWHTWYVHWSRLLWTKVACSLWTGLYIRAVWCAGCSLIEVRPRWAIATQFHGYATYEAIYTQNLISSSHSELSSVQQHSSRSDLLMETMGRVDRRLSAWQHIFSPYARVSWPAALFPMHIVSNVSTSCCYDIEHIPSLVFQMRSMDAFSERSEEK